jgi:hypothetical protein
MNTRRAFAACQRMKNLEAGFQKAGGVGTIVRGKCDFFIYFQAF